MREYRRKPLIVKAEQFLHDVIPEGVKSGYVKEDGQTYYYLKTLGGNKDIEQGDWVIYDGNERIVCSPDEFQRNYILTEPAAVQMHPDPRQAHAGDEREAKPL